MKRYRKPATVLLFAFICFNFFLATQGISSVMLTLSLYLLVGWGLVLLIGIFFKDKQLRLNLLTAAVSFLMALFVAELALRYVFKNHISYTERNEDFFYGSPYERWGLQNFINRYVFHKSLYLSIVQQPNTTHHPPSAEFNYTHLYNSFGLRGTLPDKAAQNLLIGLGDSFTEGLGAPEDSTWPALLAKANSLAFVNGGIIGSDPVQEFVVLQELLKTYRPQQVVVAMNNSDINDVVMRGGIHRYDAQGNIRSRPAPWWDMLYGCSFICRSIVHDVLHYNHFLMSEKQWLREQQAAEDTLVQLIAKHYLPLAQQYHFQFTIALMPGREELQQNNFSMQQLAQKMATLPHLQVVNLFDCYQNHLANNKQLPEDFYWPIDGHHNPRGYALMAQCIFYQFK